MGALIGHKAGERQAGLQLKMQDLVGKVMSVAAVVAYFIAFAARATLWRLAVFLAIPALTLLAARPQDPGWHTGVPGLIGTIRGS